MSLSNDTPISGLPEKQRNPIFNDLLITSQLISPGQYYTAKLTIATIYSLFIANISIANVQQLQQALDAMQQEIDGKLDGSHTHAITEVTELQNILNNKAAIIHSHTISQIAGLQAALDKKLDSTNLALSISQVTGLQTALNQKAALNHTHDIISNVQSDWNATSGDAMILNKPTTMPPATHSHNYADITGAKPPANAQKNSDITRAEIEAKLTGQISTHTHPNQGVEADDVLDIQLDGLDIANAEAGKINQTDTIRESFAKLQRQINLLGFHDHNGIIDIGGENYYPYVVGDGILYNTGQTITIQPGYYRLVAHSTPTMENTGGSDGLEVIVTRVLTGEIILKTSDFGVRKNWLSEIRKRAVGGFKNQPSTYQSITDWVYSDMTEFKEGVDNWQISDEGLYYLFDTSNQITRPPKIVDNWKPSGASDFGVGIAVVSTIFHFIEPTDLSLTIPVMSYDPVHHDPTWGGTSAAGKGYVWFRKVAPPSGG